MVLHYLSGPDVMITRFLRKSQEKQKGREGHVTIEDQEIHTDCWL